MPTIDISKRDLCSLIGKALTTQEISELLHYAKSTLESEQGDLLRVEISDVNRPDLWSSEGIARALKGLQRDNAPSFSSYETASGL